MIRYFLSHCSCVLIDFNIADHINITMGKKMGLNSKAVAAKDRKNEKAASEKAAKEAALEDAKWVDDNKQLAKKQVLD